MYISAVVLTNLCDSVCYILSVLAKISLLYSVLSICQLQHRLTEEGVYPAVAESIAECLSIRREELRQQLIQSSCAISQAHLVDFDWQVKVPILSVYVCALLE